MGMISMEMISIGMISMGMINTGMISMGMISMGMIAVIGTVHMLRHQMRRGFANDKGLLPEGDPEAEPLVGVRV